MNEHNITNNTAKAAQPTTAAKKTVIKATSKRPQLPEPSETATPMKQTHDMMPNQYQPGLPQARISQTPMGIADTVSMQQPDIYPPAVSQQGMIQSPMAQQGMMQPSLSQQSIFQPMQQAQQVIPSRTSIMTSGRGVRNSVLSDTNFTQGFLQTQIGRHVKVEFLLGTNMFVDREGVLVKVGTDYIIIQETETDDYLLCDIYSIKFIRFYY
jgi:hypothetical protein